MKKTWNVNVNGVSHTIEYIARYGVKILVNGEIHKVKSQNWFVNMIDYPIKIDNTEFRVVAIGNKVDLAENGIYQGSKESYTPLRKVPAMSNVFIAISCIAGFLLCGIIGMLIGILFAPFYVKNGFAKKTGAVVGAFVGCTAIQVAIMYVVNFLIV